MFSMTDDLPARIPDAADTTGTETSWPQVAAVLADLDARVRSLTTTGQVSDLDVRHARRESRRLLRAVPADLGLCESCRQAPAVRRVVFGNGGVAVVCTPCSGGAVAGVAA